jgi:DNA-binding beta-propeller fold protein YncE
MFVRNMTILAAFGIALGIGAAGDATGLPGELPPAQEQTAPAKSAAADTQLTKPAQDQSPTQRVTPVDAASAQPADVPLTGHTGAVRAVAFSRDGKAIATAGTDKTIRVWDPVTGQQTAKMDMPNGASCVAFSPDGKQLVAGSASKAGRAVVLFDAATGKQAWRTKEIGVDEIALAFSPNGTRVVACFAGGTATMYHAQTGRILFAFGGHIGGVTAAAAFSPDGKSLALGMGGGGMVYLVDSQTGQALRDFGRGNGDVAALGFFPEGKKIAVADGGRAARILDMATGKEEKGFEGKKAIRTLALTLDGNLALIARDGGEVQVWDVPIGRQERQFAALEAVNAIAVSPDGKQVVTAGEKGMVIVWDLTRDKKPLPKDFRLTEKDLASSWADLGSDEGGEAYAALRMLRADPARSVPFLKERLKPRAGRPEEKKIKQLIAELDADEFATREKASNELGKLGKAAENTMRQALAAGPSLETKKRLERLLSLLGTYRPISPEQQRDVRAVRVLEQAGTPEAMTLLESLTKESPGWWVTQEATVALERLRHRGEK